MDNQKPAENQPKVEKIVTVCPYCFEPKRGKISCCGEVHFETAYDVDGQIFLESELKRKDK